VDPAIQAAEVRQMLEAKSERRRQRGEPPLDVGAETARLLAAAEQPRGAEAIDAELRAEVRQLVVTRNHRRLREGLEPLDIEDETERQLTDLIGSN
jgi:tRNA A37 N6-isopentenylltransferase MiaA